VVLVIASLFESFIWRRLIVLLAFAVRMRLN